MAAKVWSSPSAPIADKTAESSHWQHLEARPHPWRRQLYIKGRRLRAFSVWSTMQTERMSVEEAAEDWDLSMEVIREIIGYCEENREPLGREADQEKQWLLEHGVALAPADR